MRNPGIGCLLLAVAGGLTGCNKSDAPAGHAVSGAAAAAPDKAVSAFLSAICSQNENQMFALLTEDARTGLKAKGISPQLPSSGTTSFEVGEMEQVEGGAHVASKWIEQANDGSRQVTEVLWMLRQEPAGWRVAGMAMKVFDDLPAVILNFEDPDDMIRKLDLIAQEDERRAQDEPREAAREGDASATR
jgi:hypothetical protein